jgi:hypothetical protein
MTCNRMEQYPPVPDPLVSEQIQVFRLKLDPQ